MDLDEKARLVLGLSLALLFPLLVIRVGYKENTPVAAWLQVGSGVSSISTEYTHITLDELEEFPELRDALKERDFIVRGFDVAEAYKAVQYLGNVKEIMDHGYVDEDGRIFHVYMVKVDAYYMYLTIWLGEP